MTLIANRISQDTYDNRLKECLASNARLMIPQMKTLMDLPIDQVGDCKEITFRSITWTTSPYLSRNMVIIGIPFSLGYMLLITPKQVP